MQPKIFLPNARFEQRRRINTSAAPIPDPLYIQEKEMNIGGLSTNGLKLLHSTIAAALAEDDALPKSAKKYGVREYPDWRRQADDFEAELTNRNERFAPIAW